MELLRLYGAVRECGVLAEDDEGAVRVAAEFLRGGADVVGHLAGRHAFLQLLHRRADGGEGDVVGVLHEGDLGRRLDHAAAGRDRRGAHELRARQFLADAIIDEEAQALLDADLAGGAAIAEDAGDDAVGAFVLLPRADVGGALDELTCARFLEPWRDPREVAARGDDDGEGAFAVSPFHAGVVVHARAAFEYEGVDAVLDHEAAGLLDARLAFVVGDGDDLWGRGRGGVRDCERARARADGRSAGEGGRVQQELPTFHSWIPIGDVREYGGCSVMGRDVRGIDSRLLADGSLLKPLPLQLWCYLTSDVCYYGTATAEASVCSHQPAVWSQLGVTTLFTERGRTSLCACGHP